MSIKDDSNLIQNFREIEDGMPLSTDELCVITGEYYEK